jgi:hypothetical protein
LTPRSPKSYEVETLFRNNRFQTAPGARVASPATLVDFAQPSNSQIGEIVIDVTSSSDETRRDNYIRREACSRRSTLTHASSRADRRGA